jgi:putative hydrolase of the HAD superfamily
MKESIPEILFLDIGGILLSNGWGHDSRRKAAEKFNLDYEEMEDLHHFVFNIYEIGKITLDEYLETVIFNHPRAFTPEAFKAFMYDESVELPDMLPWLKSWKQQNRVRVIALNNEGRELNDFRINRFRLCDCFDAFISSCEVGMRKPDPDIYRLATRIAHCAPQQCLYLDDRPELAQAACKQGIQGYHHRDFLSTKNLLEKIIPWNQ